MSNLATQMTSTLFDTTTNSPTTKLTSTMAMKKTSAIATRGLESFALFQSKEFVSGYQNFVTIQPLNK
ncbi:MAG: hypothetical protein EBU08_19210, partial [Micrococcales bacterium]|nr:hypothetical protein [Micrococcales bacterium]